MDAKVKAQSSLAKRVAAGLVACLGLVGCATAPTIDTQYAPFAALEQRAGGRLGVAALDTGTGSMISYRGQERFAMCSSFKLHLAALILKKADDGQLDLQTELPITRADLIPPAPSIEANLEKGTAPIAALAEAAQVFSDNGATNVLLRHIGGPQAFTATLRTLDDAQTRLDQYEPEMCRVKTGDPRDTTTPVAIATTTTRMLTSDWLSASSKTTLIGWMEKTKTGAKRIRAGLPSNWRSGDKTGTGKSDGSPDRYNDIAIAWPTPNGAPIIITTYYEAPVKSENMRDEDQAVLAEAGRLAAAWVETSRR